MQSKTCDYKSLSSRSFSLFKLFLDLLLGDFNVQQLKVDIETEITAEKSFWRVATTQSWCNRQMV